MSDHLRLPNPVATSSRRSQGSPQDDKAAVNRPQKATTIAGILAGLQSSGQNVYPLANSEDELIELGRVVLKFTTKGAPKKGPLNRLKMIPLGENGSSEYFTLSDDESRKLFAELVSRYGGNTNADVEDPKSWYELLDQIEEIKVYGRDDRIDASLNLGAVPSQQVDIVLWPTSILADRAARKVALDRLSEVEDFIKQHDGVIHSSDSRPDTLLIRAEVSRSLLDLLLEHPLVARVRGPLTATDLPRRTLEGPDISSIPSPSGTVIGVIDDLVIRANPLMDAVVQESASFPSEKIFGAATSHGTSVASIAAYGDLTQALQGGKVPTPFPIAAARIAEADANRRPTVKGNIVELFEQALTWVRSQGARVAVVAFAYDYPDMDPLPTELSATIDRLSRDLEIVIVVSAGNLRDVNDSHWRNDYPKYLGDASARVAAPGTSALAITVGSVAVSGQASDASLTAIAPSRELSPFSRTGPTRGNRFGKTRKPEFLAPGGNWGWRDGAAAPVHNDPSLGVVTIAPRVHPTFEISTGTSIAAPYVAHQVAKIATRYPNAGPNLLRALTALSADSPSNRPGQRFDKTVVPSAYGIPNADRILESEGNHAILVFEGCILRDSREILTLPIPAEFAQNYTETRRRVRIALAFDPPVRRSRRDYTAGRMYFDFVQNMSLELVKKIWEAQPSIKDAAENGLERFDLPPTSQRPRAIPGIDSLKSNTLVRRDIETNTWNADDENYFLVVSHDSSPWMPPQLKDFPNQNYAVAIELVDEARTSLDLHALTQAQLSAQIRAEARARV